MEKEEQRSKNRLTDEDLIILKEIVKTIDVEVLNEMIKSEKNMRWLWSAARNASLWVVGVITAVTLSYDSLVSMLKNMVGK